MVTFFLSWVINSLYELCLLPLHNAEFSTVQDLLAMYVADSHNSPTTSQKIPSFKLQEFLKIPSKLPENPGCMWFFLILQKLCTKMFGKDNFFWGMLRKLLSYISLYRSFLKKVSKINILCQKLFLKNSVS